MLFLLQAGVANEKTAKFAPVLGRGFPIFRHGGEVLALSLVNVVRCVCNMEMVNFGTSKHGERAEGDDFRSWVRAHLRAVAAD